MGLMDWLGQYENQDKLGTFLRASGAAMQGQSTSPILSQYMQKQAAQKALSKQEAEKAKADAAQRAGADRAKELIYGMFGGGASAPAQSTPYAARNSAMSQHGGPTVAASSQMSNADREILARTIMAEAGGESPEGMLAVGSVINNRVGSGGYGDSLRDVIMKPGQFSAWNKHTGYAGGEGGLDMASMSPSEQAYMAADAILSGQYKDPTGGATHYYNPNVVSPKWGSDAGGNWADIGNHRFGMADAGRDTYQPPQMDPKRASEILMSEHVPDAVKSMVLAQMQPTEQAKGVEVDGKIVNPYTGEVIFQGEERAAKPTARQSEINDLMRVHGIDEATASKITDGIITVSRDPVTGEAVIVDKLNPPQSQATPPAQTPVASEEITPDGLSFGGAFTSTPSSFGVEGAIKGGANTLADSLGFGSPFPAVSSTQADFGVMKEDLTNKIASAYKRQPNKGLLDNIQKLIPDAGSIKQGAEGAKSKLEALGRNFANEEKILQTQLRNRRLSPSDRAEIEGQLTAVQSSKAMIESAVQSFSGGAGQNKTASGISWSVEP